MNSFFEDNDNDNSREVFDYQIFYLIKFRIFAKGSKISLTASKVIHIDQTHPMACPRRVHVSDCVPLISAWVVLEDLVY